MASIEQLHLAHLPSTVTIHGALFTQVRNADFLRAQLLAGNADFEYAFIDASMVRAERALGQSIAVLTGRPRARSSSPGPTCWRPSSGPSMSPSTPSPRAATCTRRLSSI